MTTNLLWADDDCNDSLAPFARMLVRRGKFSLATSTGYTEAVERLQNANGVDNTRFFSLLVDIVLPHKQTGGSLSTSLGLRLAEKAAESGIKAVSFLTVVRLDEVLDKFEHLKKTYGNVRWTYFDKVSLLEKDEIDKLIASLSPAAESNCSERV